MIEHSIAERVLVIGPDLNGRGGISSVIQYHSRLSEPFHFIASCKGGKSIAGKYFHAMLVFFRCFCYFLTQPICIVHIHTASYNDFWRNALFMIYAKLFRKQVILHIHGGKFEQFYMSHKYMVRHVCRKADALVTVSTYFVDFLKKEQMNHKVFLLPNGIYPSKTIHNKIDRYPIQLLYLGALDEQKGIFDVLKCLYIYKEELQNKVILHIWGNKDTATLHRLIKQYNLYESVIYHGWATAEQKERLFNAADIFIHPSYFESFGISILEAMSYRLPIITTSVGGITDLVKDNVNGIFVDPGNIEQIHMAIERLVNDAALRTKMGIESEKKATRFTPDKIERILQSIYMELLNN